MNSSQMSKLTKVELLEKLIDERILFFDKNRDLKPLGELARKEVIEVDENGIQFSEKIRFKVLEWMKANEDLLLGVLDAARGFKLSRNLVNSAVTQYKLVQTLINETITTLVKKQEVSTKAMAILVRMGDEMTDNVMGGLVNRYSVRKEEIRRIKRNN